MSDFIYGKTLDGRDIILDGYRIESFSRITQTPSINAEIVEVIFKSGQVARLISNDWDSLQEKLAAVFQVEPLHSEISYVLTHFTKIDGAKGSFNRRSVEFLISWKQCDEFDGKELEYAELHFASGKTFTVFADSLDTGVLNVIEDSVVDNYIGKRKIESGELAR